MCDFIQSENLLLLIEVFIPQQFSVIIDIRKLCHLAVFYLSHLLLFYTFIVNVFLPFLDFFMIKFYFLCCPSNFLLLLLLLL